MEIIPILNSILILALIIVVAIKIRRNDKARCQLETEINFLVRWTKKNRKDLNHLLLESDKKRDTI